MKKLKNWDNNTWLSSKKYINAFNNFLNSKIKFNKNTQILDIGCGRANIISALQKKYKFNNKPIGVDVVKNRNIKKNVIFVKNNALNYLKKTNRNFDVILIKQTIHFFKKNQINLLGLKFPKLEINGKNPSSVAKVKVKLNEINE